MLKKLNWQAYTDGERNKVIEEVKDVISSSDGYILNFQMFSDLALSLSIEIEGNGIHTFHQAISSVLKISNLDEDIINVKSKKEWLIFLNIPFSRGKGDLERKIPAVPG